MKPCDFSSDHLINDHKNCSVPNTFIWDFETFVLSNSRWQTFSIFKSPLPIECLAGINKEEICSGIHCGSSLLNVIRLNTLYDALILKVTFEFVICTDMIFWSDCHVISWKSQYLQISSFVVLWSSHVALEQYELEKNMFEFSFLGAVSL